jgi:hypothetical protein
MIIKTQQIQNWTGDLKLLLEGLRSDNMCHKAKTSILQGLINSMDEEIDTAHKSAIKTLVEKHGDEVGLTVNEIKITTTA